MLALASPVIIAELGWMGMGVVDTIMVGRLGAEAIGAVSVGSMVYFTVALFGMGILLGLDPMVAQAYGAGKFADCQRTLVHGIYLGLIVAPPLMALVWWGAPWLELTGIHPHVARPAVAYMRVLTWSTPPLLLYSALRRYLQGIGLVRPVTFALVTANLVNLAGNWALVFGRLGLPALGVVGSAWATSLARVYLATMLLITVVWHAYVEKTGLFHVSLDLEWPRLLRLLKLGVPAGLQLILELGIFALATLMAGWFPPSSLAAHQIVLNAASVTFMVPLGVASAGAVRVGHALGRRDPQGARRAGWTALALGAGFMACSGLAFLLIPRALMAVYTTEPEVIRVGLALFVVAAVFQLFDGLQVTATGALRGAGETRIPMLTNLVAHWAVGLPVGYLLGFPAGLGVVGLWIGLSIGLITAGIVLLAAWARKTSKFDQRVFSS